MSLDRSTIKLMQSSNDLRGNAPKRTDDRANKMTRYIGGHNRRNHPYISGYWYMAIKLPAALFNNDDHRQNDERWLHSSAETFNPPSRTLTKVDVPGIGGLGASFIAGQQLTRTFSMEFREYQDTPMSNIFDRWTSVIDSQYGVSHLGANEYIPQNYKGAAFVMMCKPTIDQGISKTISVPDIERFYFFEGVFPEGMPDDLYSSDIATNDVARVNISFSFDGWPIGKENSDILKRGLSVFNAHTLTYSEQNRHTQSSAANVSSSRGDLLSTGDF